MDPWSIGTSSACGRGFQHSLKRMAFHERLCRKVSNPPHMSQFVKGDFQKELL